MSEIRTMCHALIVAACGLRVCICTLTEQRAKSAFERYVDALERMGLDRGVWTVHSTSGNRYIRFESGGECRFTSREPSRISGASWEQVVFDEWISGKTVPRGEFEVVFDE